MFRPYLTAKQPRPGEFTDTDTSDASDWPGFYLTPDSSGTAFPAPVPAYDAAGQTYFGAGTQAGDSGDVIAIDLTEDIDGLRGGSLSFSGSLTTSTSGLLSSYTSGLPGGYNITVNFKGTWTPRFPNKLPTALGRRQSDGP